MASDVTDGERATLRAVADYQFGRGAGAALFDGPLVASRSQTGRLRQVIDAGSIGASTNDPDGPGGSEDSDGPGGSDDSVGTGSGDRTDDVDHFADPTARIVSLGRDGRLTLGVTGGERLVAGLAAPTARVVVGEESEPFVRDGKNAFAKFVRSVDPDVRSRDEVAVVDPEDRLLAVGRAELDATSMGAFDTGMAVKVRDGVPAPEDP